MAEFHRSGAALGSTSPWAAIAENLDPADPQTFPPTVSAMLASIGHAMTPTGFPPSSAMATGLPGGDLDGDGLEDVVLFSTSASHPVEARRGLDGTILWTTTLPGLLTLPPQPVGDATGDGKDDLLLLALDSQTALDEGSCLASACASATEKTWTWHLTLLSGADGASVWSKPIEGGAQTASASTAPPIGKSESVAISTATVVLPVVSGDELVLNVLDVTKATGRTGVRTPSGFADFLWVTTQPQWVSTLAQVMDLEDGQTKLERWTLDPASAALLVPADDATGDGVPDFLWTESRSPRPATVCTTVIGYVCRDIAAGARLRIEMMDGTDGAVTWVKEHDPPSHAFALPLRADLDDDGKADVMLWDSTALAGTFALSGNDGHTLWWGPYRTVLPVPSLGGQPGADLVQTLVMYTSTEFSIHLVRIDGATGGYLSGTARSLPWSPSAFSITAGILGDADGDNMPDLFVHFSSCACSGPNPPQPTSRAWVESLVTGTPLLDLQGTQQLVIHPAGDLDDDGKADVVIQKTPLLGTVTSADLEGWSLEAGSLWTRTESLQNESLAWVATSDLDGDGASDGLMIRQGSTSIHVDVMDGAAGTVSWSA